MREVIIPLDEYTDLVVSEQLDGKFAFYVGDHNDEGPEVAIIDQEELRNVAAKLQVFSQTFD